MNTLEQGRKFLSEVDQTSQNWDSLAKHLAMHGMNLDGTPPPRQFSAGFGNLNYLISVNNQLQVLRRPPMGPIQPGSNDMVRESKILNRLWEKFPLAPLCHHVCENTAVLGGAFFIMDYRPGLVINGSISKELTENSGIKLGRMMAEQLANLHAIDPAEVGLEKLGNPEGFLVRTLRGWSKRAAAAWEGERNSGLDRVSNWLEKRLTPGTRTTLLHNDFKLDNIILSQDTLDPKAIIDWDMGTRGDPRWDLAVMLGYWTEASDPEVMLELDQMPTASHGFPSREKIFHLYKEFSAFDMDGFHAIRVLAIFRTAVIFRQLYMRYLHGDTADVRFARFGKSADGLLGFALDVANEKYF